MSIIRWLNMPLTNDQAILCFLISYLVSLYLINRIYQWWDDRH